MASTVEETVNFFCPENSEFYAANVYEPLDRERDEFRYLEILPGSNDDVVKCNFVKPSENFEYEALSYCAGSPLETERILVNGRRFNVFATLFGALVALRDPDKKRVFWIDQICINQNDVKERNHQVTKMRFVYQNAVRVVAWLGPLEDGQIGIDTVYELYSAYLQRIASFLKENASSKELEFDDELRINQIVGDEYLKELVLAERPGGEALLHKAKGLGHLYNSDFWKRVWIWQELIVAKSIQLLWDHASMDPEPFRKVADILLFLVSYADDRDMLLGLKLICFPFNRPRTLVFTSTLLLNRRVEWRRNNYALDFRTMLRDARGAQSSDPRDRIYALVGLIHPEYKLAISYSDTVASVYCFTFSTIISTKNSFNILTDCSNPRTENPYSLPTWCPDWSRRPSWRYPLLDFSSLEPYNGHFVAGKSLNGSCRVETLNEGDGRALRFVLHVEGLRVDTVQEIGCHPLSGINYTRKSYNEILESWVLLIKGKRPPNEDMEAELARTATLDVCGSPGTREVLEAMNIMLYKKLKMDVEDGDRLFFVTKKGFMGMAPPHVSPGDVIVVLPGTYVPMLLRRVEEFYILIGEVYLSDGYMEGRAVDEFERGKTSLESFAIH